MSDGGGVPSVGDFSWGGLLQQRGGGAIPGQRESFTLRKKRGSLNLKLSNTNKCPLCPLPCNRLAAAPMDESLLGGLDDELADGAHISVVVVEAMETELPPAGEQPRVQLPRHVLNLSRTVSR